MCFEKNPFSLAEVVEMDCGDRDQPRELSLAADGVRALWDVRRVAGLPRTSHASSVAASSSMSTVV